MDKVQQIINGLLAGEEFNHKVQDEFELEVRVSESYGPQACFNACGSFVTVDIKSLEQAAYLFLGFQGIDKISDVD